MLKLNYKHLGIFALGTLLSFSSCDNDSDENNNYISLNQVYAIMDGDNHDDLKSYQQGCVLPEHGIHNKWSNEPGKDDIKLFTYEKNPEGEYISYMTETYELYSLNEEYHTASFKAKNNYLTVKTSCPVLAAHNGDWNYNPMGGTYFMG